MSDKSKIRFIHNVQRAPSVDIYLDDKAIALQLTYKDITSYLEVNSGKHKISVYLSSNNSTPILVKVLDFVCEQEYTAIIAGGLDDLPSNLSLLTYRDNFECPKGGYANLRFIHAAYGAPGVDVYVNDELMFSNVRYKETGKPKYASVVIGRITQRGFPAPTVLLVKAYGTNTIVYGPVDIYPDNKGIYTVIATDWNRDRSSVETIISKDNSFREDECVALKRDFDVQAYMGKWYQIASIPQFYNKDCERSTAEYTLLSNRVNVYNTCYDKEWNPIRSITGSAVAPNPCLPSALIVSFPETPVETQPNYLIHSTDYTNYAIVGSPTLTSFFILSRKSKICVKEYKEMLSYAKRLGYDISRVKYDYHALTNRCERTCSHD